MPSEQGQASEGPRGLPPEKRLQLDAENTHIRLVVDYAFAMQAHRLRGPLERVRNVLRQADPGNLDPATLALVMAVEHLADAVEELTSPLHLPPLEWDEHGRAKPLPPLTWRGGAGDPRAGACHAGMTGG